MAADLCQRPVANRRVAFEKPFHVGHDLIEACEAKCSSLPVHQVHSQFQNEIDRADFRSRSLPEKIGCVTADSSMNQTLVVTAS
jgi:hypothetical protein